METGRRSAKFPRAPGINRRVALVDESFVYL
jgi:hypothetical protein